MASLSSTPPPRDAAAETVYLPASRFEDLPAGNPHAETEVRTEPFIDAPPATPAASPVAAVFAMLESLAPGKPPVAPMPDIFQRLSKR